ncbi:MAG: MaoC family dehydratase N-terminal domain-containing protein [Actinobacteria bacterium]|nr:MaoC family dehydratase N-terminal domain-containing protein [Actinomycetota bacterium]
MIAPAAAPVIAAGAGLTSVEHTVHERYLRAFAAGVGDLSPALFDLDSPQGIVAHPVYPVCLEWPLILAGPPGLGLDDDAVHAGLHVSHEIAWTRPIRPGDQLRTTLRVETLEQRSAGVLAVFAFATVTPDGEPVVESHQGVLYRGATLGVAPIASATPRAPAPAPTGALHEVARFRVEPADAVVYSECSGIWNPIHTDPRAARLAGLPHPVLHGTATLARTISAVVGSRLGGDPTRLTRLSVRFTAPIAAGDEATVAVTDLRDGALSFTTRKADGVAVLDDGIVEARPI